MEKRGFVASQPFAGSRGLGAAPGMGRGWDTQLCGLSFCLNEFILEKKEK